MAWNGNAPDSNGKPQYSSQKPDTPPDLDEVLKDLQRKLKNLFGVKKPNLFKNPSSFSSQPPSGSGSAQSFSLSVMPIAVFIGIILLAIWVLSGFFIVEPAEKAAILRFGKYTGTDEPGLHWIPPFIETRYVLNVQQLLTYPYHAEMLTEDENIVLVDLVVQYRVDNLKNYLFDVANPIESLQQATASALRQVIGQTTLDDVLTSGREKVRQETQDVLEKTLARYHAGLIITDVNMQPAKPPEEVTSAFDDAIKAREDEQRFKNQATTYANRVVPVAQGQAARLMAEANGYQQQVVLNAQGETAKFLALLPQYQKSPLITRERMYLETIQAVLSQSSKILIDTPERSNNMFYLPLDKLVNSSSASVLKPESGSSESSSAAMLPSVSSASANSALSNTQNTQTTIQDSNYPNRPLATNGQGGE